MEGQANADYMLMLVASSITYVLKQTVTDISDVVLSSQQHKTRHTGTTKCVSSGQYTLPTGLVWPFTWDVNATSLL